MMNGCSHGGTHAFHAWTDPMEGAATAAAFLMGGRPSDAGILFAGDGIAARIRDRLRRIARVGAHNDFVHIRPDEVFVGAGPSPIGGLIALRNRLAGEALIASSRVRMVILPGDDSTDAELRDRAEAFESMFTGHGQPPGTVLALCMYDARRYDPAVLELACAAHPWIMLDGRTVENPQSLDPRAFRDSRVA